MELPAPHLPILFFFCSFLHNNAGPCQRRTTGKESLALSRASDTAARRQSCPTLCKTSHLHLELTHADSGS